MKTTKREKIARFYESMGNLGFTYGETETLRRAEMTLHRWAEAECNGEIQRDDETNKPRRYYGAEMQHSTPTADREAGALRRIAAVLAKHPELTFYHQTDPRGCALYVIHKSDLNGADISSCYTSGFAVCIG